MVYLLLTILCSTSIALILKQNDNRGGDAVLLLAGNYLVATVISCVFFVTDMSAGYSLTSFLFGAVLGLLFVLTFFAFAKAVGAAGTALSTLSSRLSVVVPLVLSIIIFNENPSSTNILGFLFTFVTIYLFYKSLRQQGEKHLHKLEYFYLIAVLVGIGINDFAMKIFEQTRPLNEKPFFLMTIFGFAFIYSAGYVAHKRIPIDRRTMNRGLLLGIPNIFSSFFLISALSELRGIIVYPVTNIGIILLTTILAMLIWNEKLNTYALLALVAGVVAIILLGIN
jgi:drug/metabolite transporter (DMT)-like permease